jgi:hypothetical protein
VAKEPTFAKAQAGAACGTSGERDEARAFLKAHWLVFFRVRLPTILDNF